MLSAQKKVGSVTKAYVIIRQSAAFSLDTRPEIISQQIKTLKTKHSVCYSISKQLKWCFYIERQAKTPVISVCKQQSWSIDHIDTWYRTDIKLQR